MQQEIAIKHRIAKIQKEKNLTDERVNLFIEVFHLLDLDHNLIVDEKELRLGLESAGRFPEVDEFKEMIKSVDADGSDEIDLPEFVLFTANMAETDIVQHFSTSMGVSPRRNNQQRSIVAAPTEPKNDTFTHLEKAEQEMQDTLEVQASPRKSKAKILPLG